jgi:hypothetical protein
MRKAPRFRYTISQWMVLVAAVALGLSVSRFWASPELQVALGLLAVAVVVFLAVVVLNRLVESVFGIQCPVCGRWTLHRLARYRRYYRCSACRARLKRFGPGPWRDASGPDEDVLFRGNVAARAWKGFTGAVEPGETTSGRLLRNKRQRVPHDDPE